MTDENKTTKVTGSNGACKSISVFTQNVDENTYLKQLQLEDADDLFVLTDSCRDYLREWLPWVDGTKSVKDSETFIRTTLSQAAGGNGFQTGIWHHAKLVGVIGLHQVDSFNRTTSIGYWLGESFQGKGLMTKACRTLVDYAFNKMRLNRVEIRCGVENKQSRAVPERLGFKQEGVIREGEWVYDHFVDHKVYGMLKNDWVSTG
jgi:ribosomal-protein-serine acetyltransferase